MKLREAKTAYTFDDVMLVPQYSEIKSRKDPNVRTCLGKMELNIPIVSAPMNTITELQMLHCMDKLGGTSVLHRYMSLEDQKKQIIDFGLTSKGERSRPPNFFVAIGATGDYLERALVLQDILGVNNFCIDVANGHSKLCINAADKLRKAIPNANIMAGNVCSYQGALMLADVGVDILRCGVGGGSMCKTRIVTGHGVPQLTALEDCLRIKEIGFDEVSFVADGGIRNSGDIVKALAIGCDAVMIGGLLAGTEETPGEVLQETYFNPQMIKPERTGKKYKKYAGMASSEGRKFNGWFSEEDASFIPEGEATEVPYKGSAKNIIDNLIGGLKVGMSYAGAATLKELQENAEWVKVTNAGHYEGTPHGVKR